MAMNVPLVGALYGVWLAVVMAGVLTAGYGVSRLLLHIGLLQPAAEGYFLPDRERTRALRIARRQIPYALLAFVVAATIAFIWLPTLMWRAIVFPSMLVHLGVIEGGELNSTHGWLAIFFANFMVQAPFQVLAYIGALWRHSRTG